MTTVARPAPRQDVGDVVSRTFSMIGNSIHSPVADRDDPGPGGGPGWQHSAVAKSDGREPCCATFFGSEAFETMGVGGSGRDRHTAGQGSTDRAFSRG